MASSCAVNTFGDVFVGASNIHTHCNRALNKVIDKLHYIAGYIRCISQRSLKLVEWTPEISRRQLL